MAKSKGPRVPHNLSSVSDLIRGKIDEANRNTLAYHERLEKLRHKFQQQTARFLQTGYAYISAQFTHDAEYYLKLNPATFMRDVARAHDRFPIIAEEVPGAYHRPRHVMMSVPKAKRLDNIIGALLTLSNEGGDKPWHYPPIARCDTPGKWVFYFMPGEGERLLAEITEAWLKHPVTRISLNLPPPTPNRQDH